jgi:hypothetical protein
MTENNPVLYGNDLGNKKFMGHFANKKFMGTLCQ